MKPIATTLCLAGTLLVVPAFGQQSSEALVAQGRELFKQAVACEEALGAEEGAAPACAAKYTLAAEAFRKAYEIEPAPKHLFNQAQAERLAGDCDSAIEHYRAFLLTEPDDARRDTTITQLHKCGASPTAPAPTAPAPTAPSPTPPAPSAIVPQPPVPLPAPVVREPPLRWYEDALGDVLLGVGVAGIAVGVALLATSFAGEGALGDAPDYATHRDDVSGVETFRSAGAVVAALSGAFVAGAIVRYVIVDGSEPQVALTWDGAAIHMGFVLGLP
jgi:tetratricopeptide (TPR) repeat protein